MNDPPRPRVRVVEAPARGRPELRAVRIVFERNPNPDTAYLDDDDLRDRRRDYRRGAFYFVDVRAEADVAIQETTQLLTSPGLSEIESDTEQEALDKFIDVEWKALRNVLKTIGVSTEQLPLEAKREWVEWRT